MTLYSRFVDFVAEMRELGLAPELNFELVRLDTDEFEIRLVMPTYKVVANGDHDSVEEAMVKLVDRFEQGTLDEFFE